MENKQNKKKHHSQHIILIILFGYWRQIHKISKPTKIFVGKLYNIENEMHFILKRNKRDNETCLNNKIKKYMYEHKNFYIK